MNALAESDRPTIERRPIESRDQWLLWRQGDVTASDVGSLFGLNPFRTILRVWAEKAGLALPIEDNATLRRGRWGEAAVIEMLRDERPKWDIRRARVYLRDPSIRLGATPDAAAFDPAREGVGAIQCKTTTRRVFEDHWHDQPPLAYQLQALTEAMLMGADWAAIATLVLDAGGGWEPHIFEVARHPPAEARIRAAVTRFWAECEAGRMPAVDPARDAQTIGELYPKPLQTAPIDLSADNALPPALAERAGLKATIKAAETRVEAIETDLKAKLGVHERAIVPGWKVSWRTEHVDTYVVAAKDRRVLRVTAQKEREHA